MKKLIILPLILFLLTSCQGTGVVTKTDYGLGTVITVTIYEGGDEEVLNESLNLLKEYEKKLSRNIASSDVSRINSSGGNATVVDKSSALLIERGIYYGKLSEGLFDITIGKLSALWGFDNEAKVPTIDDINNAKSTVNYKNILVSGNEVTLKGGGAIDLGGIAKGYIADEMAAFLKEKGVTSAIINLGGNVYAVGDKKGKPFKVGIQSPFSKSETICMVEAADCSVVTSGIYERMFESSGEVYHHILNPHTGYPEDNTLASVTVVSQSSADGDALATLLFLQGETKGFKTAENIPGVEALFVDKNGNIKATGGLEYFKQ